MPHISSNTYFYTDHKAIDRLFLIDFHNVRISINQQFSQNSPLIFFTVIFMITFLLFVNSTMGQVFIMRGKGMTEDIQVSSNFERDTIIFWIADQRLDLGKGYTNSEKIWPTLYSE